MSSQQASVDGNSHQWSCETLVDGLAHVKSRSQPPEDEEDLLKKLEDTTHVSLFWKHCDSLRTWAETISLW